MLGTSIRFSERGVWILDCWSDPYFQPWWVSLKKNKIFPPWKSFFFLSSYQYVGWLDKFVKLYNQAVLFCFPQWPHQSYSKKCWSRWKNFLKTLAQLWSRGWVITHSVSSFGRALSGITFHFFPDALTRASENGKLITHGIQQSFPFISL